MKKYPLHFLLMIIASLSGVITAAPVDQWFNTANRFYENKQYDSAVIYYEKILETGIHNSDVFYNLGNTYFRLHKLGMALLYFEKARKQDPTDQDIFANIKFSQLNIIDRVPEPRRSFFETILWRLHTFFSLNAQLWILFGCLMFLSLSYVLGMFVSHNIRLWLIYTASIAIILSTFLGISIGIKIYDAEKKQFAIVLEKTVDAKNQPDGNKVLFTVHEGTKFQIKKTVGDWSFVSLPNGVSGWVKNEALGKI